MREDLATYLREGVVFHRNENNGGLILKMPNGHAVKLFPSKGLLFSGSRRLLRQTKAHKQWRSAQLLRSLGLSTPPPVKIALVQPWNEYECALIYEFQEDAVSARAYLKQGHRFAFWDHLAEDLSTMAAAGVLFIDFHLGNVLVDPGGNLCWIDPDVKQSKSLVRREFWPRLERMYLKYGRDAIEPEDWTYLCARLREKLPATLASAYPHEATA
ncbi:MAG: hypothetical protein O3A87_03090 [Verrucomicrobia bacterium]|nr:hypothetical protein [Verrucomicrobiota bacterium]MDA1005450.1 hypothetical protein [Verrucomicrobiota bacterium]